MRPEAWPEPYGRRPGKGGRRRENQGGEQPSAEPEPQAKGEREVYRAALCAASERGSANGAAKTFGCFSTERRNFDGFFHTVENTTAP